jgi:hypothetical protein
MARRSLDRVSLHDVSSLVMIRGECPADSRRSFGAGVAYSNVRDYSAS